MGLKCVPLKTVQVWNHHLIYLLTTDMIARLYVMQCHKDNTFYNITCYIVLLGLIDCQLFYVIYCFIVAFLSTTIVQYAFYVHVLL